MSIDSSLVDACCSLAPLSSLVVEIGGSLVTWPMLADFRFFEDWDGPLVHGRTMH